jgi:hypothetical protein
MRRTLLHTIIIKHTNLLPKSEIISKQKRKARTKFNRIEKIRRGGFFLLFCHRQIIIRHFSGSGGFPSENGGV